MKQMVLSTIIPIFMDTNNLKHWFSNIHVAYPAKNSDAFSTPSFKPKQTPKVTAAKTWKNKEEIMIRNSTQSSFQETRKLQNHQKHALACNIEARTQRATVFKEEVLSVSTPWLPLATGSEAATISMSTSSCNNELVFSTSSADPFQHILVSKR